MRNTIRSHAEERAQREAEELRVTLVHATRLAIYAFAALFLLDLVIRALLFPETHWLWPFGARATDVALMVVAARSFGRKGRSTRQLTLITSALLAASVIPLALLTLFFGGLDSTYHFHLAFYAVGVGGMLAAHWRRLTAILVPSGLVYTATLLLGVRLDPGLAPQLGDAAIVGELIVNMLLIAAVGAFAVAIGHAQWRTRSALDDARRLGRYRFKSPLGDGGMNEVWLAVDEVLERDVALKILRARHPLDARRLRFEREARATSALRSPHTVRVFDYGASEGGLAWIAMEHLQGLDLERMVTRHGPLDVRRAVHLVRQAAVSLAEAHALGLVHRDIKPANLFSLCAPGQEDHLKVLDFGIARQLDAAEASLTLVGTLVGTPAFMAPERLLGQPADARSDVYALGATFYVLVTGHLPIEGDTPYELIAAHERRAIVPPSRLSPSRLPDGADALIMGCLAFDRDARPADGAMFLRELDALGVPEWSDGDARAWWLSHRAEASDAFTAAASPDAHQAGELAA